MGCVAGTDRVATDVDDLDQEENNDTTVTTEVKQDDNDDNDNNNNVVSQNIKFDKFGLPDLSCNGKYSKLVEVSLNNILNKFLNNIECNSDSSFTFNPNLTNEDTIKFKNHPFIIKFKPFIDNIAAKIYGLSIFNLEKSKSKDNNNNFGFANVIVDNIEQLFQNEMKSSMASEYFLSFQRFVLHCFFHFFVFCALINFII